MAGVGKLFTATVVGLLHEEGALSFHDPIAAGYPDSELMAGLHVHFDINPREAVDWSKTNLKARVPTCYTPLNRKNSPRTRRRGSLSKTPD